VILCAILARWGAGGRGGVDAAGHPGSLRDVTNVNGPSGDDRLPFAEQWGPVAAWLSGAVTLAAVVVALWQARMVQRQTGIAQSEFTRLHKASLIDYEIGRRRECIHAVGDLWAAILSMAVEFRSFTDYLRDLPEGADGTVPRTDNLGPERPGEPLGDELFAALKPSTTDG
jgi:hypothetical protein